MTTLEPRRNLRPGRTLNWPGTSHSPSGPQSLTQVVQAAVRAIDDSVLRPVARRDAGVAYQPKTLLALLSYCYARDIYGSADVEDVLRRDVNFRQLCHNEFPGARVIRRFRRNNREALHCCLTVALRSLWKPQQESRDADAAIDVQIAEEASRRICKAMFIDSMDLDD